MTLEIKAEVYDAGESVCVVDYSFKEDLDPGTRVTLTVAKDVNELPYLGNDDLTLRFKSGRIRKFGLNRVSNRWIADNPNAYNSWTITLGEVVL